MSEETPILPQVTFSTFVLSLASSTLVQLGEVPDPESGALSQDLELAQHSIETLEMLHEKTKNNLTEEEHALIEGILYEVRMKFVIKKN